MPATLEQLEERIAFLERELQRTNVIVDELEGRTDQHLAGIDHHLDKQDANQQDFAQSMDRRFGHVYGQLVRRPAVYRVHRCILVPDGHQWRRTRSIWSHK